MSRNLFITGTGTDVGKTFAAGLIVKKLHDAGVRAAYYKAGMSGNERSADGTLIPGDALHVKNVSGIPQPIGEMSPYVYEHAYSPHLASRLEGNPVSFEKVREGFDQVSQKYDFVTMEGSGGITCPLDFDREELYLDQMVKRLGLSSVIVADAGLGTINYVVLTAEYMKNHGLPVKGVIFNQCHPGDVMEEDNIFMCEHLTGLPTIAKIKPGDTELEISAENLMRLYD